MIIDRHPRGVLIEAPECAAHAQLLRLGIREAMRTDGQRIPEVVLRHLAELEAQAGAYAP